MHAVEPEDPLVNRTLNEIKETINIQGSSSYLEVFNFRSRLKVGQRTLIGCCIQSFQQLTGANFIFYYGTSVFGSINTSLDSYISQIIYGCVCSPEYEARLIDKLVCSILSEPFLVFVRPCATNEAFSDESLYCRVP